MGIINIKSSKLTWCSILAALTGCSMIETPIPSSPFESPAPSTTKNPTGSVLEGGRNLAGSGTNQSSPRVIAPINRPAPKVSRFLVKWSVPASSLNVPQFRIDYGSSSTNLNFSEKLNRKDLDSSYSANNTELIFKHHLSIPGDVPSLSVRVSSISDLGQETQSAVFTSQRLADSPTN